MKDPKQGKTQDKRRPKTKKRNRKFAEEQHCVWTKCCNLKEWQKVVKDTKEWSLESQEVRNGYTIANVVTWLRPCLLLYPAQYQLNSWHLKFEFSTMHHRLAVTCSAWINWACSWLSGSSIAGGSGVLQVTPCMHLAETNSDITR